MIKKIFMLAMSFTFIMLTGSLPTFSNCTSKCRPLPDPIPSPTPSVSPTQSRVDKVHIDVDKTAKTLTLYVNDTLKKIYPIAIGKPSTPTPIGEFKVIEKAVRPDWWSPDGRIVKGGSPSNPIAERWMRLGKIQNDGTIKRTGIGIHGTIAPSSIGTASSGGCIRMYKQDVIELYPMVPIGTTVTIK